jgi:hypothetical protein
LIDTQGLCETNAGIWWGATSTPDASVVAAYTAIGQPEKANTGTGSCCAVNQVLALIDEPAVGILPVGQYAVRDKRYKLVQLTVPDCQNATAEDLEKFPPSPTKVLIELYDLENTSPENPLGLDEEGSDLLCQPAADDDPPVPCAGGERVCATSTSCLLPAELEAYNSLQAELARILNSQSPCPPAGSADGNLDQRVDQLDAQGVADFTGVGRSFFDFNHDAQTDELDAQIVAQSLGTDCLGGCRRSDLDLDGVVNELDLELLQAAFGPCVVCGADLNNDGVVNAVDQGILEGFFACTP